MGSFSCNIGRPTLIRVCWQVLLGFDCWVEVTLMAFGLLNSRCCCVLRLEGKSQVGIIPICVSSEGHICFGVTMLHKCLCLLVLVKVKIKVHAGKHQRA